MRAPFLAAFLLAASALVGVAAADDALPPGAVARLGTTRLRHTSAVEAVALSRDGKLLASASHEGIVIYETESFGEKTRIPVSSYTVALSPDGRIVTNGSDAWEITSGTVLWEKLPAGYRGGHAFSPDGKLLAVASDQVRVREVDSGCEIRQLIGHSGGVAGVAFAPDGKTIASAGGDQTIRIRDVATGRTLRSLRGRAAHALAFSADGKTLASAGEGGVTLWDPETGAERRTLEPEHERYGSASCASVAFAGESVVLAAAGAGIAVWEAATGKLLRTIHVEGWARGLAVWPDGKLVAMGTGSGVRIFDIATGEPRGLEGHGAEIDSLVFSPDGKLLLSSAQDDTIRVWDARDGAPIRTIRGKAGRGAARIAGFSPDSRSFVATFGGTQVFDVATGEAVRSFRGGHENEDRHQPRRVVLSPDGRLLATPFGQFPTRIMLWNAATGRQLRELERPDADPRALAFVDGGKTLAVELGAGIHFFDCETGDCVQRVPLATPGGFFEISPDGKTAAFGLWEIHVAAVTSGARARRIFAPSRGYGGLDQGDRAGMESLALSTDGKLLASGHQDATVRLWDVASGKELRRAKGHRGAVTAIAFSPDGKRFATGGADCTGLVWDTTAVLERADLAPPVLELLPGYEDVKTGQHYIVVRGGQTFDTLVFDRRASEIDLHTGHEGRTIYFGKDARYRLDEAPKGNVAGKETLVISGKSFECEIYDHFGEKTWFARKYPFVIKTTGGSEPSMELKEIRE